MITGATQLKERFVKLSVVFLRFAVATFSSLGGGQSYEDVSLQRHISCEQTKALIVLGCVANTLAYW